jgi:hypothetical protein
MCREYHRNSDKIQEALAAGGRDFLYWAFPLERWQAECTGKRFGLPVMILPNLAKSKAMDPAYANSVEATRDLGAMVSVHDNLAWPSHCEPKPILDAWRVRAEFGIGDDGVEFYPYWGRKHVAQCLDPEVYVSAYRNRDKFLVNVANLGLQGRTCAVRFAPEFFTRGQPARVVNAETGEALTLEAGSLALPIPRRDYRMLRVE